MLRVPDSKSQKIRKPTSASLLSPVLLAALAELAAVEDLPVATLIALLIREGLDHRLHRGRA